MPNTRHSHMPTYVRVRQNIRDVKSTHIAVLL